MLNSNFSTKFYIILNILRSLSISQFSCNYIITINLADDWHINFPSDPTNNLLCEGIGIGYKSIAKFKFCEQPMHQIYVIKYCFLLKTSLSE